MAEIKLCCGLVTLVDDADFAWLSQWKWFVINGQNGKGAPYAAATIDGARVRLHRLVLGATEGSFVDHANGDTLDNRRSNLRFCTRAENNRNARARRDSKSGLKGVEWLPSGRWRATIWTNRRRNNLGVFPSASDAGRAYDAAAIKAHGEFARLNFPERAA